jgi:SAP domain
MALQVGRGVRRIIVGNDYLEVSWDINLDEPLSDEHRQYLLDRDRRDLVAANDAEFGGEEVVATAPGLQGTEPSLTTGQTVPGASAAAPVGENVLSGNVSPGPSSTAALPDDYEEWTNDQLRAELSRRELPRSGNKEELIDRLVADDESAT